MFEDIYRSTVKHSIKPSTALPSDIGAIDRAARLISNAFSLIENHIVPGVDSLSIAEEINSFLFERGVDPGVVIRISPEDIAWHGIPGSRILKTGEILTVDVACSVRGWWADSARSFPVGPVDEKRRKLLLAAWEATRAAVSLIQEGVTGTQVSSVISEICRKYDVSLVSEGAGHGIGRRLHETPSLTYDGRTYEPLDAGQTYTAEPIITSGSGNVVFSPTGEAVTSDGEPTAHFEVTVLSLSCGRQVLGAPEWFAKEPC